MHFLAQPDNSCVDRQSSTSAGDKKNFKCHASHASACVEFQELLSCVAPQADIELLQEKARKKQSPEEKFLLATLLICPCPCTEAIVLSLPVSSCCFHFFFESLMRAGCRGCAGIFLQRMAKVSAEEEHFLLLDSFLGHGATGAKQQHTLWSAVKSKVLEHLLTTHKIKSCWNRTVS